MKVAVVSSDWGRGNPRPPGGSGWMRAHLPARALEELGHDVVVGSGVAVAPTGRLVPLSHEGKLLMVEPDVLLAQRWMNRQAAQATRDARAAGQVVVQDVDDWFWGLDPANAAHKHTSKAADPENNRVLYAANVAAATAVSVSTEFLARRIRERFGVPTVLLRNMIDRPAFPVQPVRPVTDGIVVGWVGAIGWRSGDLETLRGVLDPFLESCGGTFVHHGTFPHDTDTAAARFGVASERTGPSRWSVPPIDYPELLDGFDVGIVPLADKPFNHAKSWIKGLEYAAAGVPFVAYRTREYEQLGCGLLARTPGEWRAALEQLRDPAERERQRARGLEVAAANDLRRRGVEWERALATLLEDVPSRV